MKSKIVYRFCSLSSKKCIQLEYQYGCNNYAPMPVVLAKGRGNLLYAFKKIGALVWDCEGKEYLDFMAGISSVNQGHCHPRLQRVIQEQCATLTQVARICHHNKLGDLQEYLHRSYFAQGGVDADESAILMARRWAYQIKGVPDGHAKILFPKKTFWGRSIAARAGSDDPLRQNKFGPFDGLGFDLIDFDSPQALEDALRNDAHVCAYLVEPILGEGGLVFPKKGYLKQIQEICRKYKVLLIFDEIQTGLGRTGELLAHYFEDRVKPDMVVLGKSLSGGFYPMSCLLGSSEVLDLIKPGEMGSTYGGNPLACAIAKEAIQIILEEKLVENSAKLGQQLSKGLEQHKKSRYVKEIRGRGLFQAIEFGKDAPPGFGWEFANKLLENGLLTRPSMKDMLIRLSPPLVIDAKQIEKSVDIFNKTFSYFEQ